MIVSIMAAIDCVHAAFSCFPGEVIAISFVFDGDSYSPLISVLAHRLQRRKAVRFMETFMCCCFEFKHSV